MLNLINRNIPIFIHICAKMGLKDPFLNRDEYGNAAPIWEECNEYRALSEVTWFKFVKDDNGNDRVSLSIKELDKFGYLSDDIELFNKLKFYKGE